MPAPLNRAEFAELVERAPRTVQRWTDAGMPYRKRGRQYVIEPAKAIPWVLEFMDQQTTRPGSHRERLVKAQADKAELGNEILRGTLLQRGHVSELEAGAIAALESQLGGVAARLAKAVASDPNPASVRQLLLDEHRKIRCRYARALAKLFERPPPGTAGDGRSKPGTRKKRTRRHAT